MNLQRMLPASPDAERGIICSALIAPRDVCALCAEHRVAAEMFHSPAYATVYGALMEMWDARQPIDNVTLTQKLHDRGILDTVGGAAVISQLFNFLPTAANASYYLRILEEKWTLREIIRVAAGAMTRAYEEQDEPVAVVEQFEQEALAIRAHSARHEASAPKQAVMKALDAIEALYNRRGAISGLSTGFERFDHMTDGLHPKLMYVIAARPSMGKTAIAMNMAEYIAVEGGKPVGVFSMEMGEEQLWQRLLASRARVNGSRLRDGFLTERDFPALTVAASKFAESKLYIDDSSGLTIQALRGKARRMKQRHDIKVLFVDYLQMMTTSSKKRDNRTHEVAEISTGLKALAKELEIPVVVLAQLNRNVEERTGKMRGKPRLSDLRESGSIEQDADLVGLLSRSEYYAEDEEEKERLCGQAILDIAKQRNGPIGEIPLTFLKEFTRFEARATTE